MLLAGDIGGTHTRLALFDSKGALKAKHKKSFASNKYKNLQSIVLEYLRDTPCDVKGACFGVAGPVRKGKCQATNLPWKIDVKVLGKAIHTKRVFLLNDLEANAYGLEVLKPSDFFTLNPGTKHDGNQALISAGTGLGEAGLYWDGEKHLPFACEGGHCDFAPRNQEEVDLLFWLQKSFKHVSYERVVSGPGLYAIYRYLLEKKKIKKSQAVDKEMKKKDPSFVVSEWGRLQKDMGCTKALHWFLSIYGAEAGNLALKYLAVGGVFVGGGIAPHLAKLMKKKEFLSAFFHKGRFEKLLRSIPIKVVLNDEAALLGAASFARAHS